jgi:hypothetical protein
MKTHLDKVQGRLFGPMKETETQRKKVSESNTIILMYVLHLIIIYLNCRWARKDEIVFVAHIEQVRIAFKEGRYLCFAWDM